MNRNTFFSILLIFTSIFAQEADSTMNLSGGLGSITIDGEIYNQISLRPEIPIGKFGIGLDFYLNINSNGKIHTADYDFSDIKSGARTVLDKIRFIRYGKNTDPFYFTFGNLDNVKIGNGILVNGYSNALEYPANRKLGFNFGADFGTIGLEFVMSDFKYEPGLISSRLNYKIIPGLDLGFSIATDINQYAGLSNRDNDDYPDVYDHYPDDPEKFSESLESYEENSEFWNTMYIELGQPGGSDGFFNWYDSIPGLNHNYYKPQSSPKNDVLGFSFDLNYNFNKKLNLYSQFGTLLANEDDLFLTSDSVFSPGWGLVPLGLSYNLGPIQFSAEYRMNSRYFLFNYWDRSYELNRAVVSFENDEILTKENSLKNYGKMSGVYSQFSGNIANILYLTSSYTYMKGEVMIDQDVFEIQQNNSFTSILSLNKNFIPRLKKAEAFYQQNNVPNPFYFEFTETSLYGYVVGFQLSPDMILQYKSTTSFVMSPDGGYEPQSTILVETQFAF